MPPTAAVSPVQPAIVVTGILQRLMAAGVVKQTDAAAVQETSQRQKIPVATLLTERKLATQAQITHATAEEFGVPLVDATALDVTQMPLNALGEEFILANKVLPVHRRGQRLTVAVSDLGNTEVLDAIRFKANTSVSYLLATPEALAQVIEQAFAQAGISASGFTEEDDGLEGLSSSGEADLEQDDKAGGVDAAGDDTPIVKFVNKVLVDAIKRGASDIHFEPYEANYRVRFRMDGILRPVASPPQKFNARLASRIKVMASLDIAEKRVPQDGRIKLNLSKGKAIDFRVSTCPTLFGEKIVLRVLDGSAAKLGIDKLGYEEDQRKLFTEAIEKPYGLVLVTGPTGSGKTVSLYTALNILNTDGRNISTVEDPVEIRLHGVNQVQQHVKRGMTFAAALRSFLRQDPDVIMVGEIRDLETAEIAIKAAQTGHMVLSTLHTNDAPQTIARLMNMGIAPYNITSSVTLVIAQRLARRLHDDCKKPLDLPAAALLAEGFSEEEIKAGLKIYDAGGCAQCNDGYKGRTGIYQVMPLTDNISKIILDGGSALHVAQAAKEAGVRDLRQSALLKVKNGVCSLAEINRVTKG